MVVQFSATNSQRHTKVFLAPFYSAPYDPNNVHAGDEIHLYVLPALYGPSKFFKGFNLHDNLQSRSLLTFVHRIKLDEVSRASIASFRQV